MNTLMKLFVCVAASSALWACDPVKPAAKGPQPLGETACTPGETQPSEDGCNTCGCTENGEWACTEMACLTEEEVCNDGDTQPAEDGCNSCTCESGTWTCTELGCVGEEMAGGESACPANVASKDKMCVQVIVWAKAADGLCCQYPTPCHAPKDWATFPSEEACQKG